MSGDVLTTFDHLMQQPHGIVLVTGPDRLRQDDHAVRLAGRSTPHAPTC
jgi:hypothetical protein